MFLSVFLGVFFAGIALMLVYWSIASGAWIYLLGVPLVCYFAYKFLKGLKDFSKETSLKDWVEFFVELLKPWFYGMIIFSALILGIMLLEYLEVLPSNLTITP